MKRYNYLDAMTSDILDYIQENNIEVLDTPRSYIVSKLYDELIDGDAITGNGSGSYTFSSSLAEEYLSGNYDLLAEACDEFGGDVQILKEGAEACDVLIRCYLLPQAIEAAIDEIENE